jgi:hypothetical protein
LGELLAGVVLGNLLGRLFGAERISFIQMDQTLRVLAEVGMLIICAFVGKLAYALGVLRGYQSAGGGHRHDSTR